MPGWEEGDWRDESLCKFEESNLLNKMGLEFYDLSHPWGLGQPCWPYFEDVKIERLHGMSRSGVLTQKITTVMHSGTHIDAPAHVVPGTPFMDEVPLPYFFGTGVVVSIPKKKWEVITAEDLENARPQIREGDIVIVNTGWHKKYSASMEYFGLAPGLSEAAANWLVEKKIALFGIDTPFVDQPLATSMAAHRNGPLMKRLPAYYKAQTGRDAKADFPKWNPAHRALLAAGIPTIENIGGGVDLVKGKRVTIQALPWRFQHGDACVVRVMAILDPAGAYRVASGE